MDRVYFESLGVQYEWYRKDGQEGMVYVLSDATFLFNTAQSDKKILAELVSAYWEGFGRGEMSKAWQRACLRQLLEPLHGILANMANELTMPDGEVITVSIGLWAERWHEKLTRALALLDYP